MISLYPLLVVFCGSLASGFSLFKRDGLKVLSPTRGERFSTGIDIEIRWEVSDAKQVKLELRKGLPDSLTTVHSISSATSNNGSYQWRSRDDSFLRAPSTAKLPTAPPTGCDYLIAVRDTERLANSDYFAIINPRDGDLAKDAECPGAAPSSQSQGNPSATGGNQNRGAENSQGSVSVALLGGAIGGVAGGLILGFAIIVFLGRSRGWFVSDAHIRGIVAGEIDATRRYTNCDHKPPIGAAPIYQMPGRPEET